EHGEVGPRVVGADQRGGAAVHARGQHAKTRGVLRADAFGDQQPHEMRAGRGGLFFEGGEGRGKVGVDAQPLRGEHGQFGGQAHRLDPDLVSPRRTGEGGGGRGQYRAALAGRTGDGGAPSGGGLEVDEDLLVVERADREQQRVRHGGSAGEVGLLGAGLGAARRLRVARVDPAPAVGHRGPGRRGGGVRVGEHQVHGGRIGVDVRERRREAARGFAAGAQFAQRLVDDVDGVARRGGPDGALDLGDRRVRRRDDGGAGPLAAAPPGGGGQPGEQGGGQDRRADQRYVRQHVGDRVQDGTVAGVLA